MRTKSPVGVVRGGAIGHRSWDPHTVTADDLIQNYDSAWATDFLRLGRELRRALDDTDEQLTQLDTLRLSRARQTTRRMIGPRSGIVIFGRCSNGS
jgi:hypothetical protein